MKMKTTKGFTLTELLIVMAIIVVLAAVAIPTFGKQLETARETGDMEVIRNAYTEALSIAALDAEDGKLNGKIGDGAVDNTKDAKATIGGTAPAAVTVKKAEDVSSGQKATDVIWGSVWWAGAPTTKTSFLGAGETDEEAHATGKYAVKLHNTTDVGSTSDKTMNDAYFAQSASSKAWKYVSNQFMNVTVPEVSTSYDFLVFEFYITDGGSVALVPDDTSGSTVTPRGILPANETNS